jgi:hypothetical protein
MLVRLTQKGKDQRLPFKLLKYSILLAPRSLSFFDYILSFYDHKKAKDAISYLSESPSLRTQNSRFLEASPGFSSTPKREARAYA